MKLPNDFTLLMATSLSACLVLTGCGANQSGGWGSHIVSWSEWKADVEPVPGINEASVRFCAFGDRHALVVWSDGGGSTGASWDKSRQAIKYDGSMRAQDGRSISFECFTADGKSGSVNIDGQSFKLEDGSLFLVATSGSKTTVKQMQLRPLEPEINSLKETARADPEIFKFFEQARTSPTPDSK